MYYKQKSDVREINGSRQGYIRCFFCGEVGIIWRSAGMNKTIIVLAVLAVILLLIAFLQGGAHLVFEGFLTGGETLIGLIPLLIVAFLVAGLVSVLIPKDLVSSYLGKEAGWKGPFLGSIMGALVPGGPFFFYPLMATLIVSGANVGTMISFVAAKTLWNITRIPMEIAFVGIELTAIRFVVTFAIPVLVGSAVNALLPGYTAKVRDEVNQIQQKNDSRRSGEKIG